MTKDDIIKFIEWTNHLAYVEFIESEWQLCDGEVRWELLESGDFNYSLEVISHEPLYKDGLVLINTDNGCGETITLILEAGKEVV